MKERNTVVALVQDDRTQPIIIEFKKGAKALKVFDNIIVRRDELDLEKFLRESECPTYR